MTTIPIPAEALEAMKAVIEPEFDYGLSDEAATAAAQALLSAWPSKLMILLSNGECELVLPLPQEPSDE